MKDSRDDESLQVPGGTVCFPPSLLIMFQKLPAVSRLWSDQLVLPALGRGVAKCEIVTLE